MCGQLRHAKFQTFSAKRTLSNRGLNDGVANSMENRPYLENGERYGQDYY